MEDANRKLILHTDGFPIQKWNELPKLLGGNKSNWKLNACVGAQYDDWSASRAYLKGYRQAAELIALRIEETKCHQDTLVYPYVYCWRHNIELALKIIINEGSTQITSVRGHSIMPLWKQARPIIESMAAKENHRHLDIADDLFKSIDNLDRTGQVFRYETNNKGNRHLKNESLLNISDFHTIATSLADFLDGCICILDSQ